MQVLELEVNIEARGSIVKEMGWFSVTAPKYHSCRTTRGMSAIFIDCWESNIVKNKSHN